MSLPRSSLAPARPIRERDRKIVFFMAPKTRSDKRHARFMAGSSLVPSTGRSKGCFSGTGTSRSFMLLRNLWRAVGVTGLTAADNHLWKNFLPLARAGSNWF